MTTDDSRYVFQELATRAESKGLPAEVVELMLAIAEMENEEHALSVAFLVGIAKWFDAALAAEEAGMWD